MKRIVLWDEPGRGGTDIRRELTAAQAIEQTKATHSTYTYPTDEHALQDFLTVNGAWLVNVSEEKK